MTHPVLGLVTRDKYANLLGTGYYAFVALNGLSGLVKESPDGERLDLLAVVSEKDRSGTFRAFIATAKAHYRTICVWEVFNEFLPEVLLRYGFTPEVEPEGSGEIKTGFRWDKPTESSTASPSAGEGSSSPQP